MRVANLEGRDDGGEKPRPRIASIDAFRGLAILMMVLVNYLAGVEWVPAWLKHATDFGLTFADLVAPWFIFAIGLTYGPSLRRRAAAVGWGGAAGRAAGRYLAILGIGAILGAGEILLGLNPGRFNWGVLQAIGVAGVLALAVIRLPVLPRAAAALALLAAYQAALGLGLAPVVLSQPHGGLYGALSWAGMLALGTAVADLFFARGAKALIWCGAAALTGGLLLHVLGLGISKNRVSPAYVLVTLGISALVYLAFTLVYDFPASDRRRDLLALWGQNPLALYVLHLVLIGLFALPSLPAWYAQAAAWLVALQALALLGGLTAAGLWLERRGLIVKL